jgi:hypothetical protein
MQPVLNYSNERELDTLILSIYPSLKENSEFTLYEDDGTSLEYQTENYSNTLITQALTYGASGKNMSIDIIPDGKNYKGKPLNRVYRSEIHLIELKPAFVKSNNNILTEKKTLDELKNSESGFYFDDITSKLYVQSSGDINSAFHIEIGNIDIFSGVKKVFQVVKEYSLEQNYPNPFNPVTHIRFSVAERNQVRLSIFDILGREIAVLLNNEIRDRGKYEISFDATDLPSGIYFYKLQAGGFMEMRKMNLIK